MLDRTIPFYNTILRCDRYLTTTPVLHNGYEFRMYQDGDERKWAQLEYEIGDFDSVDEAEQYFISTYCSKKALDCRLPRYLTKPRQRRSEWDMAGSDGISRVSAVFRGKSLLANKMRII